MQYGKCEVRHMIVLDLEWNSGTDDSQFDEILEIGAVRIDTPGGKICDTFQVFCRPQVHTTMHKAAAALPELQQSYENGVPFAEAYTAFLNWAGTEPFYAAWGTDDQKVLRQNAERYQLPILVGPIYDIQAAFSRRFADPGRRLRLCDAVAYSGLPDSFTFHTALVDAMYTALLTAWTPLDRLIPSSSRHHPWMADHFKQQPRCRSPRCADIAAVLNDRGLRKQRCPICGARLWITSWFHHVQSSQYYAALCCPEHGCFLCRLTISTLDDCYRGCAAVPPLIPHELQQFSLARSGTHCICKNHTQRKRRRWHKPTSAD